MENSVRVLIVLMSHVSHSQHLVPNRLETLVVTMSERGRSSSPRPLQNTSNDGSPDVDMDKNGANHAESLSKNMPDAKVIIVNNLTRNVVETHLRTVFSFYGQIVKLDLPLFGKSGQNRGKAALEFSLPAEAHTAMSHMNGGQLDGAVLKVELSELPIRSRSPRSRSSVSRSPRPSRRNGYARDRGRGRSKSRSISRSPPGNRYRRKDDGPGFRGGRGGYSGRRGGRGGRRGGGRMGAGVSRDLQATREADITVGAVRDLVPARGPGVGAGPDLEAIQFVRAVRVHIRVQGPKRGAGADRTLILLIRGTVAAEAEVEEGPSVEEDVARAGMISGIVGLDPQRGTLTQPGTYSLFVNAVTAAMSDPSQQCGMRDTCGSKSIFGKQLPCPDDGPPKQPDSSTRAILRDICGPEFESGPVCCTQGQVETLEDNFRIVDRIVSACPACKNNFHDFFCQFTCSPNQGSFLNVTSTQTTNSDQIAVKSVDFFVRPQFAEGFFDSCKNVKFDASNGYAMDFIGGGAKNYHEFFSFLGEEKDLGSPFQINFPSTPSPLFVPLNPPARNCSDNDLGSRCTCIDCPSICPVLPELPTSDSTCHVGLLSCLSFTLILTYSIAVVGFLFGFLIQSTIRKRRERRYERLALSGEAPTSPRALVGSSSLDEHGTPLARGLIDPVETVQPKQYKLNVLLRRFFYNLGLTTASHPLLTCAIVFAAVGLINIGWTKFDIETDPVRLWVAPNSETRIQKDYFDEHFGPFYRPQQIFVTAVDQENDPVISFEHLQYIFELERHIREDLVSTPHNYTLQDVCFAPAGPDSPCVVQSIAAWFGGSLTEDDRDTYKEKIERCARSPVDCLPDFGQPLAPQYVLGGVRDANLSSYLEAPALVITAVLSASERPPSSEEQQAFERSAEEWERSLRAYLQDVQERAPSEVGLHVDFSTGVSLEEEISKEGNTDIRVVVGSYLAMFIYVGLTLGGGGNGGRNNLRSAQSGSRGWNSRWRGVTSWIRNYTLTSHTLLALFSLGLVLLSISTSVALFSLMGVKVTLVIAEVIPFLVLAVGVDNVFLLMGELGRVDAVHGLHAGNNLNSIAGWDPRFRGDDRATVEDTLLDVGDSENRMMSPTRTYSSRHFPNPNRHNQTSSLSSYSSAPSSAYPNSSYLPPPTRIALTLSLIGPSILLSTIAEAVAFLLGALVPMPAVRNFALYAAGGVVINGLLQICLLAGVGIGLDARRVEAGRIDCIPCIRLPGQIALADDEDEETLNGPALSPDRTHPVNNRNDGTGGYSALGAYDEGLARGGNSSGSSGWLARAFRRHYAPFLLKPSVKATVVIVFAGLFVAGIIGMQGIELGFDQRLALPTSSYLVPYFDKVDSYLDIGPPVYFVVRDVDVTQREGQRKLCGRFTTCETMSLSNVLEAERSRGQNQIDPLPSALSSHLQASPLFVDAEELSLLSSSQSSSYIADPAASWIDTFFSWLNPEMDTCCRVRKRDPSVLCRSSDGARVCRPCFEDREPAWNVTMEGFPEGEEFIHYAKWWLASDADEECPLGGKEGFGGSIAFGNAISGEESETIVASHFRTFHTPLRSQSEFIESLASARRIAESISESTGADVFPYSLHYVFFDQYSTITSTTQLILGLGLLSTLFITSVFLGSLRTGAIVTAVTGMVVVCVMGMMRLEGISLNAISLVNLVMAEGIAVEFCVHVARAFMSAGSGYGTSAAAGSVWGFGSADRAKRQKERDERMYIALVDVGPSVLSGITFTKLIGMCVLGLTRSKLLEIYYFRMWLTLIIAGALHGLVLLPVILSIAGGAAFPAQQEADEEWMASAIRSGYEYAPFLADDDSVASD
ncbi:hypothetical protein D9757_000230 [Collybiopsis confluens]|uniref:SSD domain-containing protein n=1 Tax=Collybiopsis confluens TaxID=2823264 RepID=A0A8H5I262_9AGAR|nr:hypothetical protein D9757_000230 [Collybiopsis confluens]